MLAVVPLLTDAAVYVCVATTLLLVPVLVDPRTMLQDYPPEVRRAVPARTKKERRLSLWLGLPFLVLLVAYPIVSTFLRDRQTGSGNGPVELFVYGAALAFSFNLWDWLILDWLIFCTLTPRFFVIPGSEGNPGYKDYAFHFRGFLIGSALSVLLGLIVVACVLSLRAVL